MAAVNYFVTHDKNLLGWILDYIWSICEETNWVLPAHEHGTVDLFAAETAFSLAELLHFIGNDFPWEIRKRVVEEIERRVFSRYFAEFNNHHWHKGTNNWCGVCNSSIGCAFLYLEKDPERLADAICQVIEGLEFFFETAYEKDGGSTEGTGYWQYGLLNFVPFAELLKERTEGDIDLLSLPRIKSVAEYPLKVAISPGCYANFADCRERVLLNPGIITRLAERTSLPGLRGLAEARLSRDNSPLEWRLPIILRDILWWSDENVEFPDIADTHLESTGVVRFVSTKPNSPPITITAKAGHNAECHNQNDVGSFILHWSGETYICDPGRGRYTKQYFAAETRYENIFNSSYGHSVPVIDGNLQKPDSRSYCGEIIDVKTTSSKKRVVMEISRAYALDCLSSLIREILMVQRGDLPVILLCDNFDLAGGSCEVEEGFMTFLPVEINGSNARIIGNLANLELLIKEPAGVKFEIREFEKECQENWREEVLKRVFFRASFPSGKQKAIVEMTFVMK